MTPIRFDGFILTADSRDRDGGCEFRFWITGDHGPALIRITGQKPVFFIPSGAVLPGTVRAERRPLELKSFDGTPVDGLYFLSNSALQEGRRLLTEAGVRTFESDVRGEDRYLMERFLCGSVSAEGADIGRNGPSVFENPTLSPSGYRPALVTMSLDIETGRDGSIYSIAMDVTGSARSGRMVAVRKPDGAGAPHPADAGAAGMGGAGATGARGGPENLRGPGASSGAAAVRVSDGSGAGPAAPLPPAADPIGYVTIADAADPTAVAVRSVADEAALLNFFIDTVRSADPDVLIGWHVIGFDLSFLDRRSRELGVPLKIGRGGGLLRITERPGSLPIADIEGRLVIDGPVALRGAFHRFSDWRLDTVAHELLGRRKDIESHGTDKVDEIERRFREDRPALARYNLEDAVLVSGIFARTAVLEQLVTRSLITGLPADQVHRSVAAFDRFFLPRIHRKGYVAPNQSDITEGAPAPGGKVFSGGAGLFEDVAVLDFKSLYPTVIRTFHIDPYSLIRAGEDPLDTPAGIQFSRTEHILPDVLGELLSRRAAAKVAGDPFLAQAVKILMNSMYGVMGSAGCRFYRSELPTAITGIGRWVLDTTAERLRAWGYQVLYGDTDSVFVRLRTEDRADPDRAGRHLAARVDEYFREIIQNRWGVPSMLELEYEKRYLRLFLPVMRSSGEAAVKRYAGLLPDGALEIKGMEFVRSDSTILARDFQYELFRRFFAGEDLAVWIRDVVNRLRAGEFDDKLVYRRRLSRPAREYQSPPPHVRAVKMLDPDGTRDLREVAYLMTPQGPVPLELNPREIDYAHYIDRQLRSVADDVLALQGESFDAVVGGKQLDLF